MLIDEGLNSVYTVLMNSNLWLKSWLTKRDSSKKEDPERIMESVNCGIPKSASHYWSHN